MHKLPNQNQLIFIAMKKIMVGLAVFSFTFSILPSVSRAAESKAKYLMKMAAISPDGTSWSDSAAKVKAYIEEKTQGQVKVTWYLGQVMGDEPDEIRKIRLGQLQGAGFTLMGMGLIDPAFKVLEMPFLLQNTDELDLVLEKMKPTFARMFEAKGFVLAGFLDVGFIYLFTQEPIITLEQLPKFKMWAWTTESVMGTFLRQVGFQNIITTPLTETLTALQTGMVNAFYSPLYAVVGLQWYTQAKYISSFTFGYTPAAILMDKKFYDSLPPQFQKIIMDAWNRYLPELVRLTREDNAKAYQSMLARGIKVGPTPDGVIEEIRKRVFPLRRELAGKYYPEELLAEIQNVLDDPNLRPKGAR